MLEELKQAQKVVGSKQARRALRDGRAKKIYIARDADQIGRASCRERVSSPV